MALKEATIFGNHESVKLNTEISVTVIVEIIVDLRKFSFMYMQVTNFNKHLFTTF